MEIGKNIIWVILGMFLMWIILKILSNVAPAKSETTAKFIALSKTGETYNLLRTNEFKELSKTMEFRELVKTLAKEQIDAMATALVGTTKTF